MRISFINTLLTLLYTGLNISPVVSVWIMVPSNDVKCRADVLFTKYKLADAAQPGCNRMARFGQNWWLRPIQKLMLPKLYAGPHFTSSYPRFELKIKSQHSYSIFQYPKYKVIFEWNKQQKVCRPRGVVTISKSGSQHRCEEFYNLHQEYDDSVHDGSFGRHFKAQRKYELQKTKSEYPSESIFDIGDIPPPRGFFRSAQSYKNDRFQELILPSSSLELSDPSGSSSKKIPENLSSQKSPVNLQKSSPFHRQNSATVPQHSNPTVKSRFSQQKSFSSTGHDSAPQLQRSHSMLSNMASGDQRFQDYEFRSENSPKSSTKAPPEMSQAPPEMSQAPPEMSQAPPEMSQAPPEMSQAPPEMSQAPPEMSQAPSEISLAPLKSEPILSDQRLHDSSENQERPQPKANTPLNEKSVLSRIMIENSQDLGLASLSKFY